MLKVFLCYSCFHEFAKRGGEIDKLIIKCFSAIAQGDIKLDKSPWFLFLSWARCSSGYSWKCQDCIAALGPKARIAHLPTALNTQQPILHMLKKKAKGRGRGKL